PIATNAGRDHLAGFGVLAHVAGKRQERQRLLVIHVGRSPALWQAGAFCVLAVAPLHIRSEAAALQDDLFAGIGILAQNAVAAVAIDSFTIGADGFTQLAGETAFRII